MKYIIDPPYGWKYGFPKPLPNNSWFEVNGQFGIVEGFDVQAWLVEEGYPQKEINFFGDKFYYRTWPNRETITEEEQTEIDS